MNLVILTQVLVVCIGLFAGIPQLVKSRQTHGTPARMARLTGVLALISSVSLTVAVTSHFMPRSIAGELLTALFVVPAVGAIGAWTAALIWFGPPTHHDKQTYIGAGIFVVASLAAMAARAWSTFLPGGG